MPIWKRLSLLGLILGVHLLYLPINRLMSGGVSLKLTLDDYVPLWPIWVVPYMAVWGWWLGCYIWAAWKMPDELYQTFGLAVVGVALSALAVFILYPTYVQRPTLVGNT